MEVKMRVEGGAEPVQEADGTELGMPGRAGARVAQGGADGPEEDAQHGAGDVRVAVQEGSQAFGKGEAERAAAYDEWADHFVASGGTRADAFAHFEAWSAEDTYFPLEAELHALGKVGFEATCVWRLDDPESHWCCGVTTVFGRRTTTAAGSVRVRRKRETRR